MSGRVNNAQILEALPNLDEKRRGLLEKRGQAERLATEIQNLSDQLQTLSDVEEIYDGVALQITEFGSISVQTVDYNLTHRGARIYQNANNKWTWGLTTYVDVFGCKGEEWHGAEYPDYDEIMKFAKDWVVHGKVPTYQAFRPLQDHLCV